MISKKKRVLDDEYHFCSKEILKQVLECKVNILLLFIEISIDF